MGNHNIIKSTLSLLLAHQVQNIILCAGARNAPFVAYLDQLKLPDLKIFSFFEERSAGFFALGLARKSQKPVAVITTSGTAVAELLPACIEAYYSGVPLIFVTADRPKRLRNTGAPQCINQPPILQAYVEQTFDIEEPHFELTNWSKQKPIHLNVCLEEPLLDESFKKIDSQKFTIKIETQEYLSNLSSKSLDAQLFKKFNQAFEQAHSPLVILGGLAPNEVDAAKKILKKLQCPFYAESGSGLRENPFAAEPQQTQLEKLQFKNGEAHLCKLYQENKFDLVVRLGSIPTTRLWRDLDFKKPKYGIFNISSLEFEGLNEAQHFQVSLQEFEQYLMQKSFKNTLCSWFDITPQLTELLKMFPESEPSMLYHYSKLIQKNDLVYIGNSLPIRYWDLYSQRTHDHHVYANRGANGIDGQISSFLGMTYEIPKTQQAWSLFGDLTSMYDLSAPWVLHEPEFKDKKIAIGIMNNQGGRIFKPMFRKQVPSGLFENSHSINFKHWAAMWNLEYEVWEKVPENFSLNSHLIIELRPQEEATDLFLKEYQKLILGIQG